MEDMLKFARFLSKLVGKAETNSDSLNKKLRQLASIGSNVCMPFYMTFLDYACKSINLVRIQSIRGI